MSRLATSFVLGYHGCDAEIAHRAVNGQISLIHSDKDYDWLGPGAYFWESDPQRAHEWAIWKVERGDYKEAAVLGAVIDLRNCLDLVARENLELVKVARDSFLSIQKKSGLAVPENKSIKGQPNTDRVLRFLDCAVLRHLHSIIEAQPSEATVVEAFDTVRGMFTEGGRLYKGSGFARRTHVQLAVRNNDCIRGLFYPPEYPPPQKE